jgi:chemotaxis protein MotA
MFAIIGIVVVFGAIVGGYLMEHGNLMVLVQPAELLIIGGAAIGTMLVANPLPTLIGIAKGVIRVFKPSPFTQAFYLDHLKMLNELFQHARKAGMVKLEADVEEPKKSEVFKKYPKFLSNHHALNFVCDTLRMYITGGVGSFELDQMMELDMEVHHQTAGVPVAALTSMADALPGASVLWPLYLAWWSLWARWEGPQRRSDIKLQLLWSVRSWAFCCATGFSARWHLTWLRATTPRGNSITAFG